MFHFLAALAAIAALSQSVPVVGKPVHFREPDPINFDGHAGFIQFYSENTDLGILAFRGQVTQSEPGLIGNELEGVPSKVSVRNLWIRTFD